MIEIVSHLSIGMLSLLMLSLFLVLFFEFINGFHDTANAVATVIYAQAMRPWHAVLLSGVFNFLGVVAGGLAVAYAIVNLLPIDLLASGDSRHLMAMILSMVAGAIIWNLGTWYFGLPASSSHTLIGAIIGVAMTQAWLTNGVIAESVNWSKAIDVGASLLFSPLMGFILAFVILVGIKKIVPRGNIHQTPYLRSGVRGKKHPPFWTRFLLIISAAGVSFAHGSNDGQKGVGLAMLALMCVMPGYFLLNIHADRYQLERAMYAAGQLEQFVAINQQKALPLLPKEHAAQTTAADGFHCTAADMSQHVDHIRSVIDSHPRVSDMTLEDRQQLRRSLLCLESFSKTLAMGYAADKPRQTYLYALAGDFSKPIEYAPLWVIIAIATSLGVGTMVGWKRVVRTVGEGIGKSHMTYAQGVSAQITTAISIACANLFGLPVSTTQILSSAVAGTAVANRSGLQKATIRNILLAWLFTFPIAMLLSGGIYFGISQFL